MNWTDSQLDTMYRHNLTGLPVERVADLLGIPAPAVQERLRRVKREDQLAHVIDLARRTVTDGTPRSLAGLDPKTLTVADLIVTAEAHGTGQTRQTVQRLRNQIERLRYHLIRDRDTAADRARVAELRLDLDIARKRAKSIEDKIRRLQGKTVSGSVDRRAKGGAARQDPDPETPTGVGV